jgi:hypothetical protein
VYEEDRLPEAVARLFDMQPKATAADNCMSIHRSVPDDESCWNSLKQWEERATSRPFVGTQRGFRIRPRLIPFKLDGLLYRWRERAEIAYYASESIGLRRFSPGQIRHNLLTPKD